MKDVPPKKSKPAIKALIKLCGCLNISQTSLPIQDSQAIIGILPKSVARKYDLNFIGDSPAA